VDINGEQRIPAPQSAVWEALNDPEALKASIPGCESVDKVSDTQFTARITMAIGPVKAKFSGDVMLSEIEAPNAYTITGKGSGGAAGFGKGSARVTLIPDGSGTLLRYAAKASVGGKLAQIGQRLVDSAAKKMADEFFTNFTAYLTAKGAAAPAAPPMTAVEGLAAGESRLAAEMPGTVAADAATASTQARSPVTSPSQNKKMSPAVWIGIAAVAAVLLIWFLTR
jgi:carbon monoxide dehydrogenase subunit G